jgi:hypothetical protein
MFTRSFSFPRTVAAIVAVTLGVLVVLVGLVRASDLDRYDALANSATVENRPLPETGKLLKNERRHDQPRPSERLSADSGGDPAPVTTRKGARS